MATQRLDGVVVRVGLQVITEMASGIMRASVLYIHIINK